MSTPLTSAEPAALAQLTPAERVTLRHSVTALERRWKGQLNVETIERFIAESLELILPNARVRTFVPVLVERLTNDRLRALVRLESDRTDLNPSVLFLCVHNAGRSQMAAGWLQHLAGDLVHVYSGGSERLPRSTRQRSTRWPRSASTSPPSTRSRGTTRSSALLTSW